MTKNTSSTGDTDAQTDTPADADAPAEPEAKPRRAEQLTDLSFAEMCVELTGYEEIAIRERFDLNLMSLLDVDYTMARRSIGYVLFKRAGNSDKDAYAAVMALPIAAVKDLFATPPKGDPDDEDSEAGKGE